MPDSTSTDLPSEPWFAGKEGTILLFRVNRRPLTQPTFFSHQPDSVLDHLTEVLLFGEPEITTGRGGRREWLLGNRVIDLRGGTLGGQIGWEKVSQVSQGRYDHNANAWVDVVEDQEISVRAPFLFESNTRILALLKHPSFDEKSVPTIFEKLCSWRVTAVPLA